jgi:hypothetical protein
MSIQVSRLDHHLWWFETRVMFCAFSHQKEWSLTFSSNWDMDIVEFRNNRWFISFQTTHTHNSKMSSKKERLARRSPREWVNCRKWSIWYGMRIHRWKVNPRPNQRPRGARGTAVNERMLSWPDPATIGQQWAVESMIPWVTKFAFVCNWSRKSLQANTDTFKGTCLCQIRFTEAAVGTCCCEVKSW